MSHTNSKGSNYGLTEMKNRNMLVDDMKAVFKDETPATNNGPFQYDQGSERVLRYNVA